MLQTGYHYGIRWIIGMVVVVVVVSSFISNGSTTTTNTTMFASLNLEGTGFSGQLYSGQENYCTSPNHLLVPIACDCCFLVDAITYDIHAVPTVAATSIH